jgi:acyl-CoA reductase-like NAD-dependent aldehyde dehydrogenase
VVREVLHWIDDTEIASSSGEMIVKHNPCTEEAQANVARGTEEDVRHAVGVAEKMFDVWAGTPIVRRGELLRDVTLLVRERRAEIAQIVHEETGKSLQDASGEVGAAIEMGFFIAGEARRFYGRTTTSAMPNRTAMTMRQPIGPCALIIAANTPIANVAWKVYPALLCGNSAVLKPSEHTPFTALWFARILREVGVPAGVLSVLHGIGGEVGARLVADPRIRLVSFTGSVPVGRSINRVAGERLAKVCLELGGKNPLLVCDDADMTTAVEAAALSAFSNAGQRCAAGSRILVFSSVYDQFRQRLLARTAQMTLGNGAGDALGPVISERQMANILASVRGAAAAGATIACGGERHGDRGYFIQPTIVENVARDAPISGHELFGPVACLYRVDGFEDALAFANATSFGLTAAIHTRSIHRAEAFRERCRAGVISINGPTYGSEPHMPFGGLKDSGNGFREAGTEVLDVYSDWKSVYVKHDPAHL